MGAGEGDAVLAGDVVTAFLRPCADGVVRACPAAPYVRCIRNCYRERTQLALGHSPTRHKTSAHVDRSQVAQVRPFSPASRNRAHEVDFLGELCTVTAEVALAD